MIQLPFPINPQPTIPPTTQSVDLRTGEEGEDVVFKEMATLYCWHDDAQWKERGVGDMKVLLNRTNGGWVAWVEGVSRS